MKNPTVNADIREVSSCKEVVEKLSNLSEKPVMTITDEMKDAVAGVLGKAQPLTKVFGDKHGKKRLFILYILLHNANGLLQPALLYEAGISSSKGVQSLKPLLDGGIVVYSETKERVPGGSSRSASYTVFLTEKGRQAVKEDLDAIRAVLLKEEWIDEEGNIY